MQLLFKLRYQRINNFEKEDLDEDERYLYLNLAVERFIKQKYAGSENGVAFEQSNKRFSDLRTLIKTSGSLSLTTITEISNGKSFTVPSDFYYPVTFLCDVTRTDTTPTNFWIDGELIEHNQIGDFLKTGFNPPVIKKPKILLEGTLGIALYEQTLSNIIVKYIKSPVVIASGTDCDLPSNTHEEIVNLAVLLAQDTIADERFQLTEKELSKVQ